MAKNRIDDYDAHVAAVEDTEASRRRAALNTLAMFQAADDARRDSQGPATPREKGGEGPAEAAPAEPNRLRGAGSAADLAAMMEKVEAARDRADEALAAAQADGDARRGAQGPAARRERGGDGPAEPWRVHGHLTTASDLCGALLAALETVRQDHGTVYGCECLASVIGDHVDKALEGSEPDAGAA